MNILKILTPNRIIGNLGEKEAAKYLRHNGYKILKRNYVAGGNEIDIIAKKSDTIVFSAPYWDLSFPAILKTYIENINVNGITFSYSDKGYPVSLCKAKKLIYITTAGGPIISDEFGFGYIKSLAKNFYGISDIVYIKAEGLDVYGANIEDILAKAKKNIEQTL